MTLRNECSYSVFRSFEKFGTKIFTYCNIKIWMSIVNICFNAIATVIYLVEVGSMVNFGSAVETARMKFCIS